MRCMTLAITISAIGWVAFATDIRAEQALELLQPPVQTANVEISTNSSSRPSYVALAANQSSAEISTPSELSPDQVPSQALRNNAPTPFVMAASMLPMTCLRYMDTDRRFHLGRQILLHYWDSCNAIRIRVPIYGKDMKLNELRNLLENAHRHAREVVGAGNAVLVAVDQACTAHHARYVQRR